MAQTHRRQYDIWVTRTAATLTVTQAFTTNGGQPMTLGAEWDGNADALTNGGLVRQKQRYFILMAL